VTKRKTTLSPQQQWNRTADLVPLCMDEFVVDNWAADAYERCLELYGKPQGHQKSPMHLGRIRYNTRHFMKGDIVLVYLNNGGAERFPVTGVSSRGYLVQYKYLRVRRWDTSRRPGQRKRESGPLEILEPPDELVGLRLAHPAVRAWVHTMGPEARR